MRSFNGFILTSHAVDIGGKLQLHYFGKISSNKSFKLIFDNQKIVFFIPKESSFTPSGIKFERKASKLKHFGKTEVDIVYLNSLSDLQKVKDYCSEAGIRAFELDIRPEERFLMERFIKGNICFQTGNLEDSENLIMATNPEIKSSQETIPLSTMSVDIETGVDGSLYSIAFEQRFQEKKTSRVFMRGETHEIQNSFTQACSNEADLIRAFMQELKYQNPALIIGWHVIGFDLMFLEKKGSELGLKLNIGVEGDQVNLYERKGAGFFASMKGRVVLDGPVVLRSAFFKFDDFKLETVAQTVLGIGKDIESDSGKVEEIERRFKEDKDGLAKYNLLDCTLVLDIFEKLKIYDLLIKRVTLCGLLIDRLSLSTAAFDFLYLPKLHRTGFVAPNRVDMLREDASTGGLVIEPTSGLHKNVAVYDFKSLYPSLMITFKIDPLGRLLAAETDSPIETPSGHFFSNQNSILPELLKDLMNQRAIAKREGNSSLSQAVKILMNSFYGILGSMRCRFYHSDLPDSITKSGHYFLKYAMDFFKNEGLEVIYGDTDSIFVKYLEETSIERQKELGEKLNKLLATHIKEKFMVESSLDCEFEKNFSQIYFTKMRSGTGGAKKRYVGISNDKIEFTGMEAVRSDWTNLAKIFQKEIYNRFFRGEDVTSFIKEFIKDLEAGLFDDELVYTKKLSKDPKEYTKNIPPHVKAALQINHTGPYRLKQVSYVVTSKGPQPIENSPSQYDYQHYIEKQLKPIADDVLVNQNLTFDSLIIGDQLSLL